MPKRCADIFTKALKKCLVLSSVALQDAMTIVYMHVYDVCMFVCLACDTAVSE